MLVKGDTRTGNCRLIVRMRHHEPVSENGVNANQMAQVGGYADHRLQKPDEPEDASNRRISVIVP